MSNLTMTPVLVVTYDRLEHLKSTISSLQKNVNAEKTDLYVASDFQKSDSEKCKVAAVRHYLKDIDGFNSVTVFERQRNYGVVDNCNSALDIIFKKYDQIIIMNDDLVTSPGFLNFFNQAFKIYSENDRVFSITGYCPPIRIPASYRFDAFFLGRMNAWGCGMTKERFNSVLEITPAEFDEFASNRKLSRAFVKSGGEDLMVMLKDVAYGTLEAWDVRCMYTQFLNEQYTLYPTQSLVQNIGHDGTGMHCKKTNKFDVPLSNRTAFRFPDELYVDRRIVKANRKFRSGHKITSFTMRALGKARSVAKQLRG